MKLTIGVNGAFLTRRWEKPENWVDVTLSCGFRRLSFCADVLDPFFSGDGSYQTDVAAEFGNIARHKGLQIVDLYTGVATHRFHGLSHYSGTVRARMMQWIEQAAQLACAIGAPAIGGHWDAFSVETLADSDETERLWNRLIETFQGLSVLVEERGLTAIFQEQMYIPSEKPWTLDEAGRFLREANDKKAGVPVFLTVDTGHACGMHYGLDAPDTDYREWLRRYAQACRVIHLQQTTPDASHHWPFTARHNEKGFVRMDAAIDAIAESKPFPGIAPPEEICLVLEYIPGSTVTEALILADLQESAEYLRQYVPDDGLEV